MKKHTHPDFTTPRSVFATVVTERVNDYFKKEGISKKGNWVLYSKTIILFSLFIGNGLLLLYGDIPPPFLLILAVFQGFFVASIGFNVMHDAVHGAYSENKTVNTLMGFSLNILGASSFLWFIKHNLIHHGWVNVKNHDEDVETGKALRLHKDSPWYPWHRYQHRYGIPLYGVLYIIWVWITDFKKIFKGKILDHSIKDKITRKEIIIFSATKVFYFFVWVYIPIQMLGFLWWALIYLIVVVVCGIVISTVFQVAHIVPDVAQFGDTDKLPHDSLVHQVLTTANFSTHNRALSWFLGGLNFQIEHHLFHKCSHVHYPAISRIVKETCEEFSLPYVEYPTFRAAVKAHRLHLKELGKKPQVFIPAA